MPYGLLAMDVDLVGAQPVQSALQSTLYGLPAVELDLAGAWPGTQYRVAINAVWAPGQGIGPGPLYSVEFNAAWARACMALN